jgi:hypothetical protein
LGIVVVPVLVVGTNSDSRQKGNTIAKKTPRKARDFFSLSEKHREQANKVAFDDR